MIIMFCVAEHDTLSGIFVFQVAELFSRYGSVDVKQFTRYRALVAVGNHMRYMQSRFYHERGVSL